MYLAFFIKNPPLRNYAAEVGGELLCRKYRFNFGKKFPVPIIIYRDQL